MNGVERARESVTGAPLLVQRRRAGCGETIRARVRASGADARDAQWVAQGLSKIAACPRCERRSLGMVLGAATWDGARLWLATFIALSLGALIICAVLDSALALFLGVSVAFLTGAFVGVRGARRTIRAIRSDAASNVLWLFCLECKTGIDEERERWMTCERCHLAVHERCAMTHAAKHVAVTVYRGSSSTE